MHGSRLAGGAILILLLGSVGCRSHKGSPSEPVSRITEVPQPEPTAFATEQGRRGPRSSEELIAFVRRAADRLESERDRAFTEFSRKGSEWNHGDTYLFVFDAASREIVFHGAEPGRVGTSLAETTGAEGRAIGEWSMHGLSGGSRRVWLFYKWLPPTSREPTWKASYLVKVRTNAGQDYIIGSGVYDLPIDRRLVTEMVNMAAEWIDRDGQGALDMIRRPKGPFVYKDTRVFVINTDGEVVADPLYPELQGKNQIDLKSADGRPIMRDLIRMIETQDSGWLEGYLWPRPGGGPAGRKDIYIRRIQLGDQTLGVASGLYVD